MKDLTFSLLVITCGREKKNKVIYVLVVVVHCRSLLKHLQVVVFFFFKLSCLCSFSFKAPNGHKSFTPLSPFKNQSSLASLSGAVNNYQLCLLRSWSL